MNTLQKIKELVDKALIDEAKLQKGIFSRGREARKALSSIQKLTKQARIEILNKMKEIQEGKK